MDTLLKFGTSHRSKGLWLCLRVVRPKTKHNGLKGTGVTGRMNQDKLDALSALQDWSKQIREFDADLMLVVGAAPHCSTKRWFSIVHLDSGFYPKITDVEICSRRAESQC
jgi:hypothetical protein